MMVIGYLLSFHGITSAASDVPMLAGVGTSVYASVVGALSFFSCIFRGRKRTHLVATLVYLPWTFVVFVSSICSSCYCQLPDAWQLASLESSLLKRCVSFGLFHVPSWSFASQVDDRLDALWSTWSDPSKATLSENFSCCGLREVNEDCPSGQKIPCITILRPAFVAGDTLYSIALFVMGGLQVRSTRECSPCFHGCALIVVGSDRHYLDDEGFSQEKARTAKRPREGRRGKPKWRRGHSKGPS
jgi:hypothetical protein